MQLRWLILYVSCAVSSYFDTRFLANPFQSARHAAINREDLERYQKLADFWRYQLLRSQDNEDALIKSGDVDMVWGSLVPDSELAKLARQEALEDELYHQLVDYWYNRFLANTSDKSSDKPVAFIRDQFEEKPVKNWLGKVTHVEYVPITALAKQAEQDAIDMHGLVDVKGRLLQHIN
jgi:hypothetical protein